MAITYVGAGTESGVATGSDSTPAYPTGLAAGDLILLWASASVVSTFATNAAPGFTRRLTNTSAATTPSSALFYKIATGSESGTITVTAPGGNNMSRMFAYRGVDTSNPFDVADALFGVSTAQQNYDIPSQTPVTDNCAAVLHAVSNNSVAGTYDPAAGYTELWDSNAGGVASTQCVDHLLDIGTVASLPSGTGVRTITRQPSALKGCAEGVLLRPIVAAPPAMTFVKSIVIG